MARTTQSDPKLNRNNAFDILRMDPLQGMGTVTFGWVCVDQPGNIPCSRTMEHLYSRVCLFWRCSIFFIEKSSTRKDLLPK